MAHKPLARSHPHIIRIERGITEHDLPGVIGHYLRDTRTGEHRHKHHFDKFLFHIAKFCHLLQM